MDEYRLDIKVRNNLILTKITQLGFKSTRSFCEHYKIPYGTFCKLINLKMSPLATGGKYRPSVITICEVINCLPEELFSQNQLDLELETNQFTKTVNEAEMMFTLQNQTVQLSLEEMVDNDRIPSEIEKALDTLTPREKKILSLRFGLDGNEAHTLEQCANQFDVNRERIRQIEAKALIKLRHRSRSWHLQELRNAEIEHVVNE